MKISYKIKIFAILIVLFVISLKIYLGLHKNFNLTYFYRQLFQSILSSIVFMVISFIFVDSIIKGQEKSNRKRLRSVAIRSLRQPIRRYLWMWFHISSNETTTQREMKNMSINDYMVSDIFIKRIKLRNFDDKYMERTTAITNKQKSLKEIVPHMVDEFRKDIKDILRMYTPSLDADTIRLLQYFAEDAHIYNVFKFWELADSDDNYWFKMVNEENIVEHLKEVLKLLEIYNKNVVETERWDNNNITNINMLYGNVPNVKW